MPLILIKETGEAAFATYPTAKDSLIAQFDPNADLLLWPWVGKWSTDVFQLTQNDIDKYYR